MSDAPMLQQAQDHMCEGGKCKECSPAQEMVASKQSLTREDTAFSVLLALVPLLVFTFFGQAGLF